MLLSWQKLGIALFLLVAVRITVLTVLNDSLWRMPANDPDGYARYARTLVHFGTFGVEPDRPSAYRPPGYPLLLLPWCMGEWPVAWGILLLHCAAGVATVLCVWRVAARMSGPGNAWIAALLTAVDPILARQSGLVMTEAVFVAFVAGLIAGWTKPPMSGPSGWLDRLALGLLLCMAGLTRPIAWLAWGSAFLLDALLSRRLREWGSVSAIALVVASPWMARNWTQFGKPILTTTHGGYTLWLGMNPIHYQEVVASEATIWPEESFQAWTRENAAATEGMDELARDQFFRNQALDWMQRHPREAAWSVLHHVSSFWSPGPNYGPTWARRGAAAFYVGLFLLAGMGLSRRNAWRPPFLVLPLLLVAFFLPHAFYWSNVRMRAPLTPALAVLAALGWQELKGRLGSPRVTPARRATTTEGDSIY